MDGRLALRMIALFALGTLVGCKKTRVLRLTYEVDVLAAYDGPKDRTEVMHLARDAMAGRLDAIVGSRAASVWTKESSLVVELSAFPPEDLRTIETLIGRSGRVGFKLSDERGTESVFGMKATVTYPPDSGISPQRERVPDGLDEAGNPKEIDSFYSFVSCQPAMYPSESTSACLERFRAWSSALKVPTDRQVGFEAVTSAVPNTATPQVRQVGWRTLYMYSRPELTQSSIIDASTTKDERAFDSRYFVTVSLSPEGARHFEETTGANVNRRFAIVLDGDIVESAPVIKQKISGGRASVAMGADDAPEKQLHDAQELELVLRGAYPAPLRLVSKEAIHPAAR